HDASAASSTSDTKTRAPQPAKLSAITLPIPPAPAVIATRSPVKSSGTGVLAPSIIENSPLPVRQPQLDPPVARIRSRALGVVQRLVLPEPGRRQPVRGHPLLHQQLDDVDRPLRRQLPVRRELSPAHRLPVRVPVHPQDP